MKILTVPQDTAMLRTKSSPIREITPEIIKFLRELGDTLKNQRNPQGVGLSAIQVGRPIRVFATWLPAAKDEGRRLKDEGKQRNELRFYINPEILDHSRETTLGEDLVTANKIHPSSLRPSSLSPRPFLEGCLSIPRVYGPVPRWSWIKASATVVKEIDLSSPSSFSLHPSSLTLDALASRVFQHELDHLNGILFTDRTLEAGLQLYESKEKELVPMEM